MDGLDILVWLVMSLTLSCCKGSEQATGNTFSQEGPTKPLLLCRWHGYASYNGEDDVSVWFFHLFLIDQLLLGGWVGLALV